MPDIHHLERRLERHHDGHGEQPIDDPPPAEQPEEKPADSEEELQARESVQAFQRAIASLPPG